MKPDDSINDEIARLRAQGDQNTATCEELARTISAVFITFVQSGLSRSEAMLLTQSWMKVTWGATS